MDILSSIASAAIGSLKDFVGKRSEPKSRAARALGDLYSAFCTCHEAYRAYTDNDRYRRMREAFEYFGPDKHSEYKIGHSIAEELYPQYKAWKAAIERLARTIIKHKDVLQIFDLQLYEILDGYYADEAHAALDAQRNDEARKWKLINYIANDARGNKCNDFEHARESLASFIRDNTEFADHF